MSIWHSSISRFIPLGFSLPIFLPSSRDCKFMQKRRVLSVSSRFLSRSVKFYSDIFHRWKFFFAITILLGACSGNFELGDEDPEQIKVFMDGVTLHRLCLFKNSFDISSPRLFKPKCVWHGPTEGHCVHSTNNRTPTVFKFMISFLCRLLMVCKEWNSPLKNSALLEARWI